MLIYTYVCPECLTPDSANSEFCNNPLDPCFGGNQKIKRRKECIGFITQTAGMPDAKTEIKAP